MRITIKHTPDCPHVERALERVALALRDSDIDATTGLEVVLDIDAAMRTGFQGSPTILIDGEDPFGQPGTGAAFACRLYATPEGTDTAPSVGQLLDALERRRGIQP